MGVSQVGEVADRCGRLAAGEAAERYGRMAVVKLMIVIGASQFVKLLIVKGATVDNRRSRARASRPVLSDVGFCSTSSGPTPGSRM